MDRDANIALDRASVRAGRWARSLGTAIAVFAAAASAAGDTSETAPPAAADSARAQPQEPTHDAALAWELDEIEQLIAQAHFRVARSLAQSTRGRLRSAALPVQPAQQARLEVLAATAAIAMNRADEARERMRAALRADSGLTLDVSTRSPKVVAVFEATRAALAADSAPQDPEP